MPYINKICSNYGGHVRTVRLKRKCAENYTKWHNKLIFFNCNQHFWLFQTVTVSAVVILHFHCLTVMLSFIVLFYSVSLFNMHNCT